MKPGWTQVYCYGQQLLGYSRFTDENVRLSLVPYGQEYRACCSNLILNRDLNGWTFHNSFKGMLAMDDWWEKTRKMIAFL
jgi:hypothetical protein